VALLIALMSAVTSSATAASPAWKLQAVTAPTHIPPKQSEEQRVTVEAAGGTFTLSREGAEGEGTLGFGKGTAETFAGGNHIEVWSIQKGTFEVGELISGVGIPPGTTIVAFLEEGLFGPIFEISANSTLSSEFVAVEAVSKQVTGVTTSSGTFAVGEELSGEGIPDGTLITSVTGGGSSITMSNFPTGGGVISLIGTGTTVPLAFNASAAEMQAALNAMPGMSPGTVVVTGGPGGTADKPYFVTFEDGLADTDVPAMVANPANLLGDHAFARVATTIPGGPGTGELVIVPANIGGAPTQGEGTAVVGPLPGGVVTAGEGGGTGWTCPVSVGASTVVCHFEDSVDPLSLSGNEPLVVPIEVTTSTPFAATAPVSISGGGAGQSTTDAEVIVSADPAGPGIQALWAGAFDADGRPSTLAGGHPYSAMALFQVNSIRGANAGFVTVGDSQDISVDLPAGFVGSPLATPRCSQSQLIEAATGETALCGRSAVVGEVTPFLTAPGASFNKQKIYNAIPARGTAAQFTARFFTPIQTLIASVRSEEGFGVRITAPNNPNYFPIFGGFTVLEGDPSGGNGRAFLANPTDCAQQAEEASQGRGPETLVGLRTYQHPTLLGTRSDPLPLLRGCHALTEAWLGRGPDPQNEVPSFSFQPTTSQASSPTGATAVLRVPQGGLADPARLRVSDLKKTTVVVPEGVSVNPASANGLQACSEAQMGYLGDSFPSPSPVRFNEAPVSCPDGSKLGTVEVKSPLLEEELDGTIYLAAQEENPFGSLLALYIAIESERFGLNLKLAGEVKPDPTRNGQLTVTFDYNPQLPFEEFTLHFRGGGPRATLATPETCGRFETKGALEPWSAEHGEALPITGTGFSTTGSCASSDASRAFAPNFEAGTTGTQAGSYSPLVVRIDRKDGEQELKSIDFTLPKGLTGKLAGIPYCSDGSIKEAESKSGKAEQANSSCPAASQLGSVDTAAGVGSEPIHVAGKVYLSGPYDGAPLSSVVITPAVAGPFDLGNVVVRAPLFVDPETAQITAKSDPIPTLLKGIPLKIRWVAINVDRRDFSLNPTNCESMAVTASIAGSSGAMANPSRHFQVSGCKGLKFKPKLRLRLKGSTKRIGHPALKAVVTYPKGAGYANIARAQVNLPHSEFLDQGNLNKTCTKPALLAGKCPKSSIYGKARAWTPLLEKPIEGHVYLVGGYGYKLPALVADLNGQIRVTLVGKVDSGRNKGIRNTFEAVPDAPVSRFVLEMKGGKRYGLLENSENLCRKPQRAIARFTAQNGLVHQIKPLIRNKCGKKSRRKKSRPGHKKSR
jgi:hypothetical protein